MVSQGRPTAYYKVNNHALEVKVPKIMGGSPGDVSENPVT